MAQVRIEVGSLPVLNLAALDPGTGVTSDAMASQLDAAFRKPFPATDFGDRDRFPDWVVVAREARRWLLREAARAHIWIDVDAEGRAVAWHRTTRAESRVLDRGYGCRVPAALRRRVSSRLVLGSPRPDDLASALGSAWLHVALHAQDGSGEGLWSLGPPGLLELEWNAKGLLASIAFPTGESACRALRAAARQTGEWPDEPPRPHPASPSR